jgi:hypothetical protein
MRDFTTFFINPFSLLRIGRDHKQLFGEDTIQRIAVQNTGGALDDIMTATVAVQTAFFGSITNLATQNAIRDSQTRSTNIVVGNFMKRNSKLNSYFISNETDKDPVYLQFFPQGVQAFTRDVHIDNVEQKIQQMITAVTNNPTVVDPNAATDYPAFLTSYKSARGLQVKTFGQVSAGISTVNTAEEAWDDQMFNNLLTFANMNRNLPDNVILYMNQQLLELDVAHTTDLTGKVKGAITDSAGHPVANVIVHIVDAKMYDAHSDKNGDYITHPMPIGTWQITFTKGDKTVTETVVITDGAELVLNVVLG